MANIFNLSQDLKQPIIYLCRKNFEKIGEISNYISDVNTTESFNSSNEMSFTVHKKVNGSANPYWNDIVNLKLIYVYEYNSYYEIEVKEETSDEDTKLVTATSLCESELSNLNLSVEINTDTDIARDDYIPTIVYNPDTPSASLLHRVLKDKAPHYQILHVDSSLARLQRTFSIDTNIDDFLRQELAAEIDAYVEYDTEKRGISMYDLLSVCDDCGYRGNFYDICPECNSTNVTNGYGEWTNVYLSKDNLADEITLSANKGTIKNSFKILGGDDTITNAVPSVNPNGSGYIVRFSDLQYDDMPTALVEKLKSYAELSDSKKAAYKGLSLNIRNCIDKILYYESEMMPSQETDDTDAVKELQKITYSLNALMSNAEAPNSIGISNFGTASAAAAANRAVLSYVEILINPDYEISILSSAYEDGIWRGKFHVESISRPEDDYADSEVNITLRVDGNDISYITQKIEKTLAARALRDKLYDFTLYGIKPLENFRDAYLSCMTLLQEHGDSAQAEASAQYQLYKKYYDLYYKVEAELSVRNATVQEWKDKQAEYEAQQKEINELLNLQTYLGDDLFRLYCAYRRDDKYENSNYLSDGLSDSEILEAAEKLIAAADQDLSDACQNQYTLTATINNLLMMPEFEPFHNKCRLGNWIYIEINGMVYSLRLIKIGVDYEAIDKITVEFSNASKVHSLSSDISDILHNARSIAASYPATVRQVSSDAKIAARINHWVDNGLDATNMMIANAPNQNITITENGILCRALDEITGDYHAAQMRIINSTIAMTDDDWLHTRTALGRYIFQDPATGEYKYSYGVIGEAIVGKLLLGENLGIYNGSQSMIFDQDGLKISNGINTFTVNPNNDELLSLSNQTGKVLYADTDGVLHIQGDGSGLDISTNKSITMKVNTADYNAENIVSMINMDETGVQISGNKVNITGCVTFNSFAEDAKGQLETAIGKIDGLETGTTTINGSCITTGTIDANKVTLSNLEVGKNVAMGADATISWNNVTNQPVILDEAQVTDITKNTVTTSYVNALKITAGSVAAEDITGATISGKTITGSTMNSSTMSGCSGDFRSIFLYDKDAEGNYQHGSICGQYVDEDNNVYQTEAIRINNTPTEAYMYVYQPMYYYNTKAYPIFHPITGISFGSSVFGKDLQAVPARIKMIHTNEAKARTGLLIGFYDAEDIQAFEIYDDYDKGTHTNVISAKLFGNLELEGTVTSQSSLKYKTNITPLSDAAALRLLDYNIVSFDYIDGRKNRHGMIAEQAAKISEYGIIRNKDNEPDAIGYIDFIPDIIRMNQIMYQEIQDLKKQITQLKSAR